MNSTEDRLRSLLAQAPPEMRGIDPDALLAPGPARSRRPRRIAIAASVAAIVSLAVAISTLGHSGTSGRPAAASPSTNGAGPSSRRIGSDSLARTLAELPASVFDAVGVPPQSAGGVTKLAGPALTANGKPEVFYVGADWAPYDAAERWALAVALSRFGTFTGLGRTASKAEDIDPNTATLSFHGAGYVSNDITVALRDVQDRAGKPLDTLTASEQALFSTLGHGGGFPFIDIAGRYQVGGAQYDPAVLEGLNQDQIAGALFDPTSAVAKAIIGSANVLTAAICDATDGQPTDTCSSGAVIAASRPLDAGAGRPANTRSTK